ncbi:hypothetical protein DN069_20310 [Streptacidiphilus pinicola]|uniref:Pepco domain-containing protein n=1 Tax=Streptacidiphilus pinicola TaxID=2219663 RepID=A0A2X0J0Q9_9ACTN|nr:hypothetical protein DN069_20310 [Streptacidiphilus pinicola]
MQLDAESYNRICSQIFTLAMAQEAGESDSVEPRRKFRVEEITVRLGVHANGSLAFVAEAGIEAGVEVTFKRA